MTAVHGVPPDLLAWQTHLRVPPGEDLRELLGHHDGYVDSAPHASPQLPTHPGHDDAWRRCGGFLDERGLRRA